MKTQRPARAIGTGETVSTRLREAVQHSTIQSMSLKQVLAALADHANEHGASCFVGGPTIAKELGCSARTVERMLKELVAGNWIDVRRPINGQRHSYYQIHVAQVAAAQDPSFLPHGRPPTNQEATPDKTAKTPDNLSVVAVSPLVLFPSKATVKGTVKTPPLPPVATGGSLTPRIVVDEVCKALDITEPRFKKVLLPVVELQVEKGTALATIGANMIVAYTEMLDAGADSGYTFGLRRFFTEGYWLDDANWRRAPREDAARIRLIASQGKVS